MRYGGFCTELAGAAAAVKAASEDLELQRAAARRGCAIERAVITVDSSRGEDADVRELLARDRSAGIRSYLIDAANALPHFDLPGGSLRFGVWDDEVVHFGAQPGRRSRRPEDIRCATAAADALRLARADERELVLTEPLARAARLARRLAPSSCRPVGAGPANCSSYHGLVQYLRLLGIAASPQRHGYFYREALSTLAHTDDYPRVLIAGAADAGMLVHVVSAYEAVGRDPEITVVDRCDTPLEVCRWYAGTRGLAITTVRCDITEFDEGRRFDVVCAESLLTLLQPGMRARAVARWRDLLRPGGRVVNVNRIASDSRQAAADPLAVDAFVAWVRAEGERRTGLLDVDAAELAKEARSYHGAIPLYPVASREELVGLFRNAGFALESLSLPALDGRAAPGQEGSSTYRAAQYARLVAVR